LPFHPAAIASGESGNHPRFRAGDQQAHGLGIVALGGGEASNALASAPFWERPVSAEPSLRSRDQPCEAGRRIPSRRVRAAGGAFSSVADQISAVSRTRSALMSAPCR
jgi:hypothetical protein